MHNIGKRKSRELPDISQSVETICDYIDTSYNKKWLGPQDFVPDNGVGTAPTISQEVAAGLDRIPVQALTDNAATSIIHSFVLRPNLWIKGHVKVKLFYFPKGSANSWRLTLRFNPVTIDSAITLASDASVTFTLADTAPAQYFRSLDITSLYSLYPAIDQSNFAYNMSILRLGADAADTATDPFEVLGIELTYVEDKVTIGMKPYTV